MLEWLFRAGRGLAGPEGRDIKTTKDICHEILMTLPTAWPDRFYILAMIVCWNSPADNDWRFLAK